MNPSKRHNSIFVERAWLYSTQKELTEEEFIKKSGGLEKLEPFKVYPFVSLVLDKKRFGLLIGHIGHNKGSITLVMKGHGHTLWQTMEWRK